MILLNILQKFFELALWFQICLVFFIPFIIIHLLRQIPVVDDWWEFGFPNRVGRKLNDITWNIKCFFSELGDSIGIKTPHISNKTVLNISKLLFGLFLIYIFLEDAPRHYSKFDFINNAIYVPGEVSELISFEDYIDNEYGNGGAFVEYEYHFSFIALSSDKITHAGWSQPYPISGNDIEKRKLPFPVTVRYHKENMNIADVPELSGLTIKSLIPGLLLAIGILSAAFYLVIISIFKIFKGN